eukprot:594517_1
MHSKRDCGKLEDECVAQERNLKQLLYHRNYKQNWRKERTQQLLELRKQQKEQGVHPKHQLNAYRTVCRPHIGHNLKSDLSKENDMYFLDNVYKIDNEHQIIKLMHVDPFHYIKFEGDVQMKTERKRQYDQLELDYQLNDAVLSGKQQKRRKRRRLNHWQIKDGAAEVGTTRN